ncbi:MAG: Integrin-like protein, partial [Candidatus Angelobacter sp.]|nr:Integrin-like protein [Candidatus Angelobacter sp.]
DIAIADALNRITLLLNTGNFKFVLSLPTIPVLSGGNVVAVDVNGDGILDIVTTGTDTSSGVKGITTLIGNGSGGFQSVFTASQQAASQYIAIGDLNGDGKPDLVYASGIAGSTIGVMFGNGDGTFQPLLAQNIYQASEGPSSVVVADFNGDGKLDIAVGNGGNGFDSQADIFLGNGQGAFSLVAQHPLLGAFPYRMIAAADLNQDGKIDLVIGNTGNGNPGSVSVLMGLGNGTFKPALVLPLKWRGEALALGDFDGDGILDIVASENGGLVELFTNKGDGTFTAPIQLAAGGGAASLFAADMNDSGANDLVAIGGEAMVLPNTGGTKMSMTSSANPSVFRQQVTLSTNLVPSVPGMPAVSGTVLLKDAGILLGSLNLPASTGFANSAFTAGVHPISATYSGDSNYFPRSLPMLSQAVNKAATTTALVSSAPKSIVGVPISLNTTVTSPAGGQMTGTVSLLDGAVVIASTTLDGLGHASFNIATPPVGTHAITARYSGDGNYNLSSSAIVNQSSIDFNVTAARPSRSHRDAAQQSAAGTFQVEVSASGREEQPVHLSCASLPSGMSCQFASPDFLLNGTRFIEATVESKTRNLQPRVRRLNTSKTLQVEVVATSGAFEKHVMIPVQIP